MVVCCSFSPGGRLAQESHKAAVYIRLLADSLADIRKENQTSALVVSVKSYGRYLRLNQKEKSVGVDMWLSGSPGRMTAKTAN